MTQRTQWFVVAGVVLAMAMGLVVASRHAPTEVVDVGWHAPDFVARTMDTPPGSRGSDHYRGRLLLLNVWATWCIPCQREMPSIERLYREFGPRGLQVAAVSIDDGGAGADIREFVREHDLTFDILHDPTGKIMQDYQMVGVPESFLIDANGVIRKKAFETDWYAEDNRDLVARLLDTGPG